MAALSADRQYQSKIAPELKSYPVKAGALIYKGAIVCVDATGYAVEGVDAAGNGVVGIASARADNTAGANGAVNVIVESGRSFLLDGSGLTQAMVGTTMFLVDDHTVQGAVNTNGTKVGLLVEYVSASQGWVFIPFGGTARGVSTANANTQTASYVQADVQSIATLANALKTWANSEVI
jgi:hypothetical protein